MLSILAAAVITLLLNPTMTTSAPAKVHAKVQVQEAPENVGVLLIFDCDNYFRSSAIELMPKQRTIDQDYRDVPAGSCAVAAVLVQRLPSGEVREKARAVKQLHIGIGEE